MALNSHGMLYQPYIEEFQYSFLLVSLLGLVLFVFIWWTIDRLFKRLSSNTQELIDTKQHFEERVLQRTREQDKLITELKGEMEKRRNIETALSSLRKKEDMRQRKKLAAELHDMLGQSLQSIKLLLKTQYADLQNGQSYNIECQHQLLEEIDVAIKQLRQMTSEIHPVFLNSMDLLQAIRSHSKVIYERIELPIIIEHDKDTYSLNDMIKEYCYLIYQETLNNIIKHSHATRVNIKLSQEQPEWLQIEFSDNGQGFDVKTIKDHGHGLILLQDRTHSMGGTVEITSTPGKGTYIHIKIPVQ